MIVSLNVLYSYSGVWGWARMNMSCSLYRDLSLIGDSSNSVYKSFSLSLRSNRMRICDSLCGSGTEQSHFIAYSSSDKNAQKNMVCRRTPKLPLTPKHTFTGLEL